jgi:ribosomal protein S18 acetylase RimI-like enzyme
MDRTNIAIRPANSEDVSFIYNSWLKQYRERSRFASPIHPKIFYDRHHKVLERILAVTSTQVLVCSPKENPETILGYLVFTNANVPILHFVYVKAAFRRLGIASALFKDAQLDPNKCVYTHRVDKRSVRDDGTSVSDFDWIQQRFPSLLYDPYLI